MLYHIYGDIHGTTCHIRESLKANPSVKSIQIGDLGFGFNKDTDLSLNKLLEDFPNLRFFRGNHDFPTYCKNHPSHLESGFHDPFFVVGGGYSIDKPYRVSRGLSWWEEEEHTQDELVELVSQYESIKPEYVLSHEPPVTASRSLFKPLWEVNSRTALALDHMFQIHQPDEWYFGHWHKAASGQIGNTYFRCVDENEMAVVST